MRMVTGERGIKRLEVLREEFPELAEVISEYAYGGLLNREDINPRIRVFITLSALISSGASDALRMHFNSARNVGITHREIRSFLIYLVPYVGIPRVLDAYNIYKDELLE